MGYEYDSKVNRDLAKTAMSIYTKAHDIKPGPINESKQSINEEALRENINSLILNYVSDVILAEQELGREMTDVEINEASIELLNRINSISDEDKTNFVTQLAEEAGAMGARGGGAVSAGKGRGSTAVSIGAGAGSGGAISNFDPSNYDGTSEASIEQLFRDVASGMYGEGAVAGSFLSQVLANQQSSPGIGTSTRSAARRSGAARRRLGEAVTASGTFGAQGDTSPYQEQFDALFNSSEYQGASGSEQGQMVANLVATIANKGDRHAGAGTARRRGSVREAVTAKGTFANKSRPENRAGTPDPLDPSSYGPGGFYDSGNFETTVDAIYANLQSAGYSNSQIGQFAAQVQALHQ